MPITVRVILGCAVAFGTPLASLAAEPVVHFAGEATFDPASTDAASIAKQPLAEETTTTGVDNGYLQDAGCCDQPLICHDVVQWCCPGWAFTMDVLFLNRSDAPSQTLVRDQTSGAEILNADDLDFDYNGVPRFRLRYQDICCNGWEAGYFGIDSWNASATSGDPSSPLFEAPGIQLPSTAPGTVFQTDYGTDFDSFELNRRIGWSRRLTLVHGFRWLHLDDHLRVSQVAPISRELFSVEADNQMYGYQLGFDLMLTNPRNRFRVDSTVRSAVLYNDADAVIRAPLLTGIPGFVDSLSSSDDHTTFFGELGFQSSYWLNRTWAFRAGYHLMWLEGVALAPAQIPINSLVAPGTAAIDTGTGLFFHGASVGLLATW